MGDNSILSIAIEGKKFVQYKTKYQIQRDITDICSHVLDWTRAVGAESFVTIGVLDASFKFVVDFSRAFPLMKGNTVDCGEYGFYSARSRNGTVKVGAPEVSFVSEKKIDVTFKNVVILDTVVGTGETVDAVAEDLARRGAKNVFVGALFCNVEMDGIPRSFATGRGTSYCPNEKQGFLVGYGMDYKGQFRGTDDVYVLR